MTHSKILIVDDESFMRQTLAEALRSWNYQSVQAGSVAEAKRVFAEEEPAVVLLDIDLPDGSGLDVLTDIKQQNPETIAVMITGNVDVKNTVAALRGGAHDFIGKPVRLEELRVTLRNALETRRLRREVKQARRERESRFNFEQIIGESAAMRKAKDLARRVAASDVASILLQGDTGTGKDLFARAIHQASPRSNAPYLAINCAALPATLIESELFGYAKGAFSGAAQAKKGKFEIADGGTLFLDEIGDMSPRVQAKMLRVLEEQRFEPVGSNRAVTVDVRVISATNQNLDELIEGGTFRADLFYRLNVIPFQIPPLRERLEDVPALIEHFNRRFSAAYGKKPKIFAPAAIEAMQNYAWLGNVRELKNTIERIVIMTAKQKIGTEDLPMMSDEKPPASSYRFPSFKEATDAYQREFIERKLAEAGGNVSRAAEIMGVDRSHLHRRIRALGVQSEKGGVK